ncbi:UNVERIFIED_CONTAM: hypothetical protein Sradi_2809900 [Sesamum radiatum]|uniref:SWIM-type domain-containing protein n=1 Tax=Sesamum radiatum TaxID=300843 RepID=A0AAW2RV36_SESRA
MKDLEIPTDSSNWTIMSDKQKGLIDAVDMLLPHCEHRFCVYSNFKVAHKGLSLKMILWKAAKATRIVDFEKTLCELRDRDKEAFKWLVKRPAAQWSRAYFRTHSKCDILLNNLCESFNATLVAARSKPIVDMLETIRMMLMKRIYVKRDQMKKHKGILCPNIQKMMEELKKKSMEYIAHWNGHDQFEIEGCYGDRHTVNLTEQTCSCRKWQLTGIPCAHAISGMFFMGYKPEDYVDECYKKAVFLKVYSHLMMPLHGPEKWPQSKRKPLLPPIIERMPGRPKKQDRKKTPQELEEIKQISKKMKVEVTNCGQKLGKLGRQGLIMTCRICGVAGHNSRSCPQNPKNQQQEQNVEVPPAEKNRKGKRKVAARQTKQEQNVERGKRKTDARNQQQVNKSTRLTRSTAAFKHAMIRSTIMSYHQVANNNDGLPQFLTVLEHVHLGLTSAYVQSLVGFF